jgi:protein-disulfide isomerase
VSSAPTTSPSTAPSPGTSASRSRNLLVPAFVLFAVLLLAFAAFVGGGDDEAATPDGAEAGAEAGAEPEQTAPTAEGEAFDPRSVERRLEGDPYAMGAVDAPVVMVEYSDFQCPFCGLFARDTHPELVDRYVADGTLRIEFRDTPILGEESVTAALGARAAANQDAFWDYHDEVFSRDRERDAGELAPDRLVEMAASLGLDVDRFRADLEDPATMEAVRRDRQEAQQLGVSSTPAFLINGRPVLGAQPLEAFVSVIEEAAAEAGA